jgi:uncharacterized protein
MCKGQCPGTAIDGDWRNRTRDCDLWKGMFRHLEEGMLDAGLQPLSASPERKEIEGAFLDLWSAGRSLTIAGARRWIDEGRDLTSVSAGGSHGDGPHGDSPHGDG